MFARGDLPPTGNPPNLGRPDASGWVSEHESNGSATTQYMSILPHVLGCGQRDGVRAGGAWPDLLRQVYRTRWTPIERELVGSLYTNARWQGGGSPISEGGLVPPLGGSGGAVDGQVGGGGTPPLGVGTAHCDRWFIAGYPIDQPAYAAPGIEPRVHPRAPPEADPSPRPLPQRGVIGEPALPPRPRRLGRPVQPADAAARAVHDRALPRAALRHLRLHRLRLPNAAAGQLRRQRRRAAATAGRPLRLHAHRRLRGVRHAAARHGGARHRHERPGSCSCPSSHVASAPSPHVASAPRHTWPPPLVAREPRPIA